MFRQFIGLLQMHQNYSLFHYGSFETKFLTRMKNQYCIDDGDLEYLQDLLANSINILSKLYGCIYFPTYSNSLKDIAKYIGFRWSEKNASGLQSLVWRHNWEASREPSLNEVLIRYNLEDCYALKLVVEIISQISNGPGCGVKCFQISDIPSETTYKFGKNIFAFRELEVVNKCAYYNYQRDKVFFRNRNVKTLQARRENLSRKYRANKIIDVPLPTKCARCDSPKLYKHGKLSKTVLDVKFFNYGVRRLVVKYNSSRVRCPLCGFTFSSPEFHNIKRKHGDCLRIWIVYQIVAMRQTYNRIQQSMWEIFGYRFNVQICHESKNLLSDYYTETYKQLKKKLTNGKLIHADETSVNIRGKKAYVWVLTSLEEVIYIYSPTREANTLTEVMSNFSGVLISDFYGAYDSFECEQQKCLIHLIRDINDDLRKHPFNDEYKSFMKEFGELLERIVSTIDRYGLKKRYLRKHVQEVDKYINKFLSTPSDSEVIIQYQKRFHRKI